MGQTPEGISVKFNEYLVNVQFSYIFFPGATEFHYEPFKKLWNMWAAEYDMIAPKKNWAPKLKRAVASIPIVGDDPTVRLFNVSVSVVHEWKSMASNMAY